MILHSRINDTSSAAGVSTPTSARMNHLAFIADGGKRLALVTWNLT